MLVVVRTERSRPHLEYQVLAVMNVLMLGSNAWAAYILKEEKYRQASEKNLAFVKEKLWDPKSKTLFHRWRDGARDDVELLEGYAFLLSGTLDLYEATIEPQHLEFAIALAETMLSKFYDPDAGGFWQSPPSAKDLILRVKEDYDGAEPSGNCVAVLALLKLGRITDRGEFTTAAEKTLRHFSQRLQTVPEAVPYMLQAFDFSLEEPVRAVVAGEISNSAKALLHALHAAYQPNKVVLGNRGPVEAFALTLPAKTGAVVYFCTGTSCRPPMSTPREVREAMKGKARG